MNIEDVKDTTDEARSFNEWFESEWKRNGVDSLVQHNDQLIANVKYLISIIEHAEKLLQHTEIFTCEKDYDVEDTDFINERDAFLQAIRK